MRSKVRDKNQNRSFTKIKILEVFMIFKENLISSMQKVLSEERGRNVTDAEASESLENLVRFFTIVLDIKKRINATRGGNDGEK